MFLFDKSTKQGLDRIPLEKIMQRVELVDKQKTVEECAKIMLEKKFSSLVIEKDQNEFGIFTKTDLVRYYSNS